MSDNECAVDLDQVDGLLLSEFQKVDVFQSFGPWSFLRDFDFSLDCAPFQVEDALNSVLSFDSEGVGHHHQMHRCETIHLNGVNTIDPSKIRCRVFLKVVEVRFGESCKEKLLFSLSHSLNYELLVVTKEEEASTRTTCLSSFEHVASINSGRQRRNNLLFRNTILLPKLSKTLNEVNFN